MKTLAFFLFMCISALSGVAQIVPVTFNGTGESTRIDWVQATNLNRNESVTFPGTKSSGYSVRCAKDVAIDDLVKDG